MGRAAIGLGDWLAATEHFERVAAQGPSALAEAGLGRALAARGRIEQAVWHFDRAATLDVENPDPSLRAGELMFDLARSAAAGSSSREWALGEAERRFKAVTSLEDPPPGAWQGLGEVRQERGAFTKALKAYRRASQRDPSLPGARIGIAEMANNLEKYDEARRVIEPLVRGGEGAVDGELWRVRAHLNLIVTLFRTREWEDGRRAIAGLFDLLATGAEEVEPLRELVWSLAKSQDSAFLYQLGRLDDAVDPAEEAVVAGGAAAPYAYLVLIAVHRARGAYGDLAEVLDRADRLYGKGSAIDDVDERVSVAQLRATVLRAKRRVDEAHDLLRAECAALPDRLELHMELVELSALQRQVSTGVEKSRWQHRLSRSVADALAVLRRRGNLPSASLVFGALEIFGGDELRACERLDKEIERDPGSYEAHALLGTAAARLGRFEEAAQSLARAVRLAPHVFPYKLALANTYVHLETRSAPRLATGRFSQGRR